MSLGQPDWGTKKATDALAATAVPCSTPSTARPSTAPTRTRPRSTMRASTWPTARPGATSRPRSTTPSRSCSRASRRGTIHHLRQQLKRFAAEHAIPTPRVGSRHPRGCHHRQVAPAHADVQFAHGHAKEAGKRGNTKYERHHADLRAVGEKIWHLAIGA